MLGLAKSFHMKFVMSYISSTSPQIIHIITVLMILVGHTKALFGIMKTFKPVLRNKKTKCQVRVAIISFILGQVALMFIGIRKLNQMGLIPNATSDWLAWEKLVDYNKGIELYSF